VTVDRSFRRFLVVGFLAAMLVAVVVSQFASSDPDGLEYVAEDEGFIDQAREHDLADTALADYGDGFTGNSALDTTVAGLVGVTVTAVVGWGLFRLVRHRHLDRAT